MGNANLSEFPYSRPDDPTTPEGSTDISDTAVLKIYIYMTASINSIHDLSSTKLRFILSREILFFPGRLKTNENNLFTNFLDNIGLKSI
jgi:hypothetical protein